MTSPTTQQADGAEPSASIERAIVTPLPPHLTVGGWSWRLVARFAFSIAIMGLGITLTLFSRGKRLPLDVGILAMVIAAVGFLLSRFLAPISRARRMRRYTERFASPWGGSIARLQCEISALESTPAIEARWKSLLTRDDRARAVVDASIAQVLAKVTLRDDLLEPEAINQSARGAAFACGMFVYFAALKALDYKSGDWWLVVVYLFGAMVFLLRVPKVRDAVPMLRDTGRDLVAGPGWLRDKKSRRWTVDDSIAIVQRTRKGRKRPGVWVRMIGPAGVRDFQFASFDNPDLAMFWERWMHPKPRLDLVA
ncbi:MAG: hypothetical protein U0572_09545 [Phycisphaerales bacterium]